MLNAYYYTKHGITCLIWKYAFEHAFEHEQMLSFLVNEIIRFQVSSQFPENTTLNLNFGCSS
jgi:hypothetical protein